MRKFELFEVKCSLAFWSTAQIGWFVTVAWNTGSSLHDGFHSSLSLKYTSVSCWLTKRSMSLHSRCAFRNTARPASWGSVSVWYRGFWKLFFVLVKAWEDSVGTTQKTEIYYNLIFPSQRVSSRKRTCSSFTFTKASCTSRNEDRTTQSAFYWSHNIFVVTTNISYNWIPHHDFLKTDYSNTKKKAWVI